MRRDLPDDLAHPKPHLAMQHLEPVFGGPDDGIAMMNNRAASALADKSVLSEAEGDWRRIATRFDRNIKNFMMQSLSPQPSSDGCNESGT